MIKIYFIESYPWVIWVDMGPVTNASRWGEWAWVGRVYE